MKRLLNKLISLGKVDIQINYHKNFNETAEQYISASREFADVDTTLMCKNNSVIRIEFLPNDKPMTATAYSHDFELALKDAYNKYLIWEPKN